MKLIITITVKKDAEFIPNYGVFIGESTTSAMALFNTETRAHQFAGLLKTEYPSIVVREIEVSKD